MSQVVLCGPDHVEPGVVTVEGIGSGLAAGITRGWAPKPYRYLDPNEDVVAVVGGKRGALLVVADGHSGREASTTAVSHVLERLGGDPPAADLSDRELVDVFDGAQAAVVDAQRRLPAPRRDSATTLTVVCVASRTVQWATMGDSVAVVAGRGNTRLLGAPTRRFVGQPVAGSVSAMVGRGAVEVDAGSWVVVATDGYSDWAPTGGDLPRATALWTAGSDDAQTVVRRLMDKAKVGGAGDNVAIAVARV